MKNLFSLLAFFDAFIRAPPRLRHAFGDGKGTGGEKGRPLTLASLPFATRPAARGPGREGKRERARLLPPRFFPIVREVVFAFPFPSLRRSPQLEDLDRLEVPLGKSLYHYVTVRPEGNCFEFKYTRPCAFIRGDDLCSIYRYRPEVCRQFPIVEEDGHLTMTWFGPCEFTKNLVVYKVLGVLLREKQQPEVADFMKLEERWKGVIAKSKSQAEQLPLAYEIVEAVSAELAKRKE
ncbi:MAG: hypothetical protein GH150_07480 [Hadesarchaea archaeon]|nr:hypothetical protein [Hadesarchaea archaeon]